jgi:tetratricopeptide (TPR) repeat protein
MREKLGGDQAGVAAAMSTMAGILKAQARSFADDGRPKEAKAQREQALKLFEGALMRQRAAGVDLVETLNNLATLHLEMEELQKADERLEEAMRQVKAKGEGREASWEEALVKGNMASVSAARGTAEGLTEALRLAEETRAIQRTCLPVDHPDIAHTLHNMGVVSYNLGKKDEAVKLLQGALTCLETSLWDGHPHYKNTKEVLRRCEAGESVPLSNAKNLHKYKRRRK